MKKVLFASTGLSVCLAFLLASDFEFPDMEPTEMHDKFPHDDIEDIAENFKRIRFNTTMGRLARYSDVIAIGRVTESDEKNITVKVETPYVGCTNGQSFFIHIQVGDYVMTYPPLHDQILFCSYTNLYEDIKAGYIEWASIIKTNEHTRILTTYQLESNLLSAWSLKWPQCLPFQEHFTNVLQIVRFDQNWTNFYYLCRNNVDNEHPDIARDSLYDLGGLIKFASTNEAHFIYNDPLLVSPEAKAYLLERHPYVKEEENE